MRGESGLKRCAECILSENYPGITLNDESICNYCISYALMSYEGEFALKSLLDSHRGKGRKYDCIVPVSGGKNSAFVLYKASACVKLLST